MNLVTAKGVDSQVAYLISSKNDTLVMEYGNKGVIDNLHEYAFMPQVFSFETKNSIIKHSGKVPKEDEALFSKYPEQDAEEKIFNKNYFLYDTINNMIVKFVQPKKIGDGVTGMYIPDLPDGHSFSIYGKNLDSTEHAFTMKMLRTVSYKDSK